MRPSDPLHLGAILCAIAALFWGLTTFFGLAMLPAFLIGLAAGIVFLFPRHVKPDQRNLLRNIAIALIAVHVVFIALFVVTTPVNIGEDPNRGFNLEPPSWALAAIGIYGTLLFMLVAILLPAGIVMLAGGLERGLAAAGAGVIVLVLLLGTLIGVGGESQASSLLFRFLIFAGFLAITAACILPPWRAEGPPWDRSTRTATSPHPSRA